MFLRLKVWTCSQAKTEMTSMAFKPFCFGNRRLFHRKLFQTLQYSKIQKASGLFGGWGGNGGSGILSYHCLVQCHSYEGPKAAQGALMTPRF